LKLVCDSVPH